MSNENLTTEQLIENRLKHHDYYQHSLIHNPKHAEKIKSIVSHQITRDNNESATIELNGKRTVIGNYDDNEVMIKKCFTHFNSMKRSLTLSQQTYEENTKLFHENNFYREMLNLELSMRTLQKNIKIENNK